jgi:hypothetical protein
LVYIIVNIIVYAFLFHQAAADYASFVHDPMGLIRPAALAASAAALPAHIAPFQGLDTTGVRRIIVSKVHARMWLLLRPVFFFFLLRQ